MSWSRLFSSTTSTFIDEWRSLHPDGESDTFWNAFFYAVGWVFMSALYYRYLIQRADAAKNRDDFNRQHPIELIDLNRA
eukprot:CAMPEP_0115142566 /NCGR_PEP_ID=MMETSP0227-20121206/60236_1 /TAXON_ID=89957 /ORGANISM="Polarella glacialis, Strain CCMP 1383" /LENGTH=78 /DNA_ID=CAMNT_0002551197 /DNA_START=297 /DNA_END=533 /DNA_ORIENTATION=-